MRGWYSGQREKKNTDNIQTNGYHIAEIRLPKSVTETSKLD